MNYLMEHKELVAFSVIVGAVLPFLFRKLWEFLFAPTFSVYSTCRWTVLRLMQCVRDWFYNAYAMGLTVGGFIALQIFWLQQWVFAYNKMGSDGNPYNLYAYFPLTVVIPMFFFNIACIIFSAIRFGETVNGSAK